MDYNSYIEEFCKFLENHLEDWVNAWREDRNIDWAEYSEDDFSESLDGIDMDDFAEYLSPLVEDEMTDVIVSSGVYKMCFIPKHQDFVVKFYFIQTEHTETEIYHTAFDYDCEQCFCKPLTEETLYDLGHGIEIYGYCQEKAIPSIEGAAKKSSLLSSNNKTLRGSLVVRRWESGSTKQFTTALVETWGEEITERLLTLFEDFNLFDFHSGNWTIIDDRVKIFDYSSL